MRKRTTQIYQPKPREQSSIDRPSPTGRELLQTTFEAETLRNGPVRSAAPGRNSVLFSGSTVRRAPTAGTGYTVQPVIFIGWSIALLKYSKTMDAG
ncbi:hypothetical protein BV898_10359 [Hypsibius exemplaris]|uniref:Uncharacterized protein n=1 Tax=Hypsibius exemplaris TaxID=2072580 RepID=A0A1W0WK01_HYPEX|nr:hypothetical protein BV898_10359 [Hypsibius exemplaris]